MPDERTFLHVNALISGGAQGIGAAVARLLRAAGAGVMVFDREGSDIADDCEYELGNIESEADLHRAVDATVDRLGGVDILVNAWSASTKLGTILGPDEAEWERLHQINLNAPRQLITSTARHMKREGKGGRIVSISSSSATRARGAGLAYGCAKAGLEALTRIAAAELARYGINVNAVAPGVTDTTLQRGLRTPAQMQEAVTSGPLENFFHRVSTADDVASAVVFLCSPGARQITGQVVHTSAGVVV